MKKCIHILIVVMILCILCTAVSFASSGSKSEKITYRSIGIYVNGIEIAPCDANGNSTEPFIRNADGSTYLPVRAVAGALGLDVDWDENTSTVILKSNGKVNIGSKSPVKTNKSETSTLYYRNITITLDGKKVELKNEQGNQVEPFIKNGTTYIPVRAVATALGLKVKWNGNTNSVYLGAETKSEYDQSYMLLSTESLTIDVDVVTPLRLYADHSNYDYTYSVTGDSSVIEILGDTNRIAVIGRKVGTATIIVRNSCGKTAECTVNVVKSDVEPDEVDLSEYSMELGVGDTRTLSATVYPSDATVKTVTWKTSNPLVATVSKDGKVTAKGTGSAEISAMACNEQDGYCKVFVTAINEDIEPKSISLNKSSMSLNEGDSVILSATVYPSDAKYKTVSWTTSNSSVATVSSYGTVTARATGTATITAKTSNGKTASCTVTVTSCSSGSTAYKSYAEFPSVPDFGSVTGVSLYSKTSVGSGAYGYSYSTSSLYDKYGSDYGESKYVEAIKNKGFKFSKNVTLSTGKTAHVYENASLGISISIAPQTASGNNYISILVSPLSGNSGTSTPSNVPSSIAYDKYPDVPCFAKKWSIYSHIFDYADKTGTFDEYDSNTLISKFGSVDRAWTYCKTMFTDYGFKITLNGDTATALNNGKHKVSILKTSSGMLISIESM